ncbi:STM4013/SEN3800 family hydrolase [Pendulispora rubella]|uniref:STM4013/SEN3800 family hydrolase n=1 Tax=Pendulispora rubella TaxID=2741070 RepID=A0ABZ2L525_9BACT
MLRMNTIVGTHDIVLVTLDTLRYDVASRALAAGRTPNFAARLGPKGWEERHSPGSFTYAAHHAIFAGFFPTPARPGRHTRLFALRFARSETVGPETCVLDGPDIVSGLAARGYHTVCIGGVGFFSKENPLGSVLPGLFTESHWSRAFHVGERRSFEHQITLVDRLTRDLPPDRRRLLFLNVSAIHRPNHHYLPGARTDSIETHGAALEYVDTHLPSLMAILERRGPTLVIFMSDHGTAYGDDGYRGHRIAHASVWTVPYAEVLLP